MPTAAPAAKKASKYGAKKVAVDGITFASKAEARRYGQLKLLERAGAISQLTLQPVYVLAPAVVLDGKKKPALRYVADFEYLDAAGNKVTEDVKGMRLQTYRMKRHLMRSIHGIEVKEISA